jgi:hypothetical protein
VAKVIGANSDAFGDAGLAMTALSRDLEHAQQVTRQAAKECAGYQNDLTTAQGQATQNASHAQTLRTQAAAAVHPQAIGELNHQAGIAQAAADAAGKAADKASGQLQIWQRKGRNADTTYAHQAQESARKIQAAAGRIQTVASLPGGAPVPVTVTPGDVALASSMLGVAGGLPSAAEAMGDPEQLNRLAGGRPITPGTMLSYMNQALAEARKQQAAGKGSLIDAAGGLVHTLTFGAVSFGNSSTPRYRGGEDAGLIPIDPESLAIDGEKLVAKGVEHEGEKEAEHVASGVGVDRGDGRDVHGKFTGQGGYGAGGEERGLEQYAKDTGQPVIATKVRATVPGLGNRYYDGLVRNPDGTYTAVETYTGVEVKSGTATLSPSQRAFDGAVDSGQPATATLDGRPIQITRTVLVRVSK